MTALDAAILDSVDAVAAASWNGLSALGSDLCSHALVRACEQSRIDGVALRHVLVSSDRSPTGAASLFRMAVPLDTLATGITRRVLGTLRALHPRFLRLPVIFCGLPVSLGACALRFSAGCKLESAASRIVSAMEDFAAETSTGLLCVKELDEDGHRALYAPLQAAGYFPAPSLSGCRLDIRWNAIEEYVDSLRSGYRRQLLADIAAGRDAGLRIESGPGLLPDAATAYGLYRDVIGRARFALETLPPAFFDALAGLPSPPLRSVVVRLGQRVVANAILLWDAPVCHFLLAGLDYERSRRGHVYQNLLIGVIEAAIALGATRLEMGQTSYPMKSRLGARMTPRHIWIRHRSPVGHELLERFASYLFPATATPERRVFRTP